MTHPRINEQPQSPLYNGPTNDEWTGPFSGTRHVLLASCGPHATNLRQIKQLQSEKSLHFEVLVCASLNWQRNLFGGMIRIQT